MEEGQIWNSDTTARLWQTNTGTRGRRTEWRVTIARSDINIDDKQCGSAGIISALTREDAINEIPNVIKRLEDLYKTIQEKSHE